MGLSYGYCFRVCSTPSVGPLAPWDLNNPKASSVGLQLYTYVAGVLHTMHPNTSPHHLPTQTHITAILGCVVLLCPCTPINLKVFGLFPPPPLNPPPLCMAGLQVLPPVVSLRTHLTCAKLQVPRWRLCVVLDPMSVCARGCGSSEGLLHTPSAEHRKKLSLGPQSIGNTGRRMCRGKFLFRSYRNCCSFSAYDSNSNRGLHRHVFMSAVTSGMGVTACCSAPYSFSLDGTHHPNPPPHPRVEDSLLKRPTLPSCGGGGG